MEAPEILDRMIDHAVFQRLKRKPVSSHLGLPEGAARRRTFYGCKVTSAKVQCTVRVQR